MDLYHVLACFQRTGSATSVNTTGFTALPYLQSGGNLDTVQSRRGCELLFRFTEARTTSRKVRSSDLLPEASRGPCVGTMSQCIGMHDREIQSKENQQGYVAHSTFTLLQTLCCFEALSAKLHYRKTDSKLLSLHCHNLYGKLSNC